MTFRDAEQQFEDRTFREYSLKLEEQDMAEEIAETEMEIENEA